MAKSVSLQADFAKPIEKGRPPNIKGLFPNSKALIVSGRGPKVFLSVSFSETEYIAGLTLLLKKEGFEVVTGMGSDGSVSRDVLRRIKEADQFLSLMTRDKQKADGTFTTSPWLLQELGAALAFDKPMALVVEEGIDDIGGLQGDWQRIHFGPKGFLKAAIDAVEHLKSSKRATTGRGKLDC